MFTGDDSPLTCQLVPKKLPLPTLDNFAQSASLRPIPVAVVHRQSTQSAGQHLSGGQGLPQGMVKQALLNTITGQVFEV